MEQRRTGCCIAGGGPAGMMLGLLLARVGVDVTVFEKHADFLRDFRGDTVHPSTMQVMDELGLLDDFLTRPHSKVRELAAFIEGERVMVADFSHLPVRAPFVAFMPQWEFLDFLAHHATPNPRFHLSMEAQVRDLLHDEGRVTGARVTTPAGELEILADLVVGADGRESVVRQKAGLAIQDLGAPIDVLWMRLSRRAADPSQAFGHLRRGHVFVTLDRGDYWQCAFVIPKHGLEERRRGDIESLRTQIAVVAPFLADRVAELRSWDDVKLLTVKIDRLREWAAPGVLCIGDAAHAMSPVGGVGINLAIQDAVATANLLGEPLRRGAPSLDELRRVQRRRELPTRVTQRVQIAAQNGLIAPTLAADAPLRVPAVARLLNAWPWLRRFPARMVGLGVRPEHVRNLASRDELEPPT